MDNFNPAQKQLELNSLIEFSQLISSKLDLKYILNNILLSIMGKMLISKGAVLLKPEENPEDCLYTIEAAKGIDSKLVNTQVEATSFPKMSVFNIQDMGLENGSNEFVQKSGFNHFFKIYFQNKYLGILCLGKKINSPELSKSEIIFIETMLNISASAIENTIKFNLVNDLNLNLNNKIHHLKSLFELGKEFNSNFVNKENIIKLLSYSLLGNFGIKDFIILSRTGNGEFIHLKENKNIKLENFDLSGLFPREKVTKEFKPAYRISGNDPDPFIKYLHDKGFQLVICAVIQNKVDNVICLGRKLVKSEYTAADIEFLESIINLSMISVQNSILFQEFLDKQKIENELKIAREIQLALLPTKIPEIKNYDIDGMNLPALQVGGDYYDIVKLTDSKFAIVIADVSGKGTPASLLMANIQSAVHSYLKLYDESSFDLSKVTEKINELIFENTLPEKFITFFWGILDSEKNTFEFINAGHNPPLLLNNNKIQMLKEGGFMIGILDFGVSYETGRIDISKDDVIVFYTDGVTEAMNKAGEEFGEERLSEVIKARKNESAGEILSAIKDSLLEFARGTAQYDDITLILLKKN